MVEEEEVERKEDSEVIRYLLNFGYFSYNSIVLNMLYDFINDLSRLESRNIFLKLQRHTLTKQIGLTVERR